MAHKEHREFRREFYCEVRDKIHDVTYSVVNFVSNREISNLRCEIRDFTIRDVLSGPP